MTPKKIPSRKNTCRSVMWNACIMTPGAAAATIVPRIVKDSRHANRLERS